MINPFAAQQTGPPGFSGRPFLISVPGSGGGSMSDGGVNIGGGSQGGGQEGPDSGTHPLFSPIDTSNLSSFTTKALYSILQ